MDISIIIPVYNVEKYLLKCISTLKKQEFKNIEFIFVDDGSTDNTFNILREEALKDIRIKILKQKNNGVSSARNLGIRNSTGKYIGFIDPDDYIEENIYLNLFNYMDNKKLDLLVYNYRMVWEEELKSRVNSFNFNNIINHFIFVQEDGYVWNKIYRRDIIMKNNIFFDENITVGEDLLFNIKYIKYVKKYKIIDNVFYNYYQRKDSAVRKKHKNLIKNSITMYKETLNLANEKKINKDVFIGATGYRFIVAFYSELENLIENKEGNKRVVEFLKKCKSNSYINDAVAKYNFIGKKYRKINIDIVILIGLYKINAYNTIYIYMMLRKYILIYKRKYIK